MPFPVSVPGVHSSTIILQFQSSANAALAQGLANSFWNAIPKLNVENQPAGAAKAADLNEFTIGDMGGKQNSGPSQGTVPAGYLGVIDAFSAATPATVTGTSGSGETVLGQGGLTYITNNPGGSNNIFDASGGGNVFAATGGNWSVLFDGGNNFVLGNTGNLFVDDNTLAGTVGAGNNLIFLGAGNDEAVLWGPKDTVVAGSGPTTIFAAGANDLVFGGSGTMLFIAVAGSSTVVAGSGNTVLFGLNGASATLFGNGNDLLVAGPGNVTLNAGGSTGNNSLFGNQGADSLVGGSGTTSFVAGFSGSTTMLGGSGVNAFDFVKGAAGGADVIQNWTAKDQVFLLGYAPGGLVSQTITPGGDVATLSDGTLITFQGLNTTIPGSHFTTT